MPYIATFNLSKMETELAQALYGIIIFEFKDAVTLKWVNLFLNHYCPGDYKILGWAGGFEQIDDYNDLSIEMLFSSKEEYMQWYLTFS